MSDQKVLLHLCNQAVLRPALLLAFEPCHMEVIQQRCYGNTIIGNAGIWKL